MAVPNVVNSTIYGKEVATQPWSAAACRPPPSRHDANAAALRALLEGAAGAYRDTVLLNAAAALVVAGKVEELRDGVAVAAQVIDSGAAREALAAMQRASAVAKVGRGRLQGLASAGGISGCRAAINLGSSSRRTTQTLSSLTSV